VARAVVGEGNPKQAMFNARIETGGDEVHTLDTPTSAGAWCPVWLLDLFAP
jgi:hypothetical protein